ncbi:unnamed protein product [Brassicogethes aeneus]|uniref:Leucine-rich repeat-containing protein 27-like n=1 Tax=Brassicogethes aeneus TaxID=1431903 RepID=A0A9P0B480_BRAAE|nr:unnamed protein product [Brassicogethes aeneus]
MSQLDVISDHAKESLVALPKEIFNQTNLKMLFMEGNLISALPEDFFQMFPQLMWLDLRNNSIERIPTGIANHPHLESLLLTNNKIKALPNELGTVANLKTLQISNNPLCYPSQKIVSEGTNYLISYLKSQYENDLPESSKSEQLIKVFDQENVSEKDTKKSKENKEILKNVYSSSHMIKELRPTLSVKKLSYPKLQNKNIYNDPPKIVHKITKDPSKICLKSYYKKEDIDEENISKHTLKDMWLEKLKILLNDQEKILQQEKNLNSLASWRLTKKKESLRNIPKEQSEVKPPFGTSAEYNKMLSREDISKELNDFLKERNLSAKSKGTATNIDVESIINDLVMQLKDMDNAQSPGTELERAGYQMKMIMDIHKKIIQLQGSSEFR